MTSLREVRFVRCAPEGGEAIIDLAEAAEPGARGVIDLGTVYREYGERWKRAFADWLGTLNIRHAGPGWWAQTSSAKNFLSSPLGNALFEVLAIASLAREVGTHTLHIVGASAGQIVTLRRYFSSQGVIVRGSGPVTEWLHAWSFLPRLVWQVLRVFACHTLRRRTSPPVARTCLLTYVDRGFRDGEDAFFGSLADLIAQRTGERPLHIALIQAPWRMLLPRLEIAARYRYWPLFHELRLVDVGAALAETLCAAWRVGRFSRAAGEIDGIDVSPLLAEALRWDLGPGGYFHNQLVFRAGRRLAGRMRPQHVIYPFEMKSLEKMFILGMRAGAPHCRLVGYQHASITPRHTTFLLAQGESAATPLPDFVVTVGDVTREYLESHGGYPAGFFRTGGALRQKQQSLLAGESAASRPLRLLLALSSSRRELADAVVLLSGLCRLRDDVEVGVRPHPEFPLSLLSPPLRQMMTAACMRDLSATPLNENLAWCDAVVYISSTVALEALMAGRPVVTLRLSGTIEPDPLLDEPPLRLRADSIPGLSACCDELRAILAAGDASIREAAVAYAHRYLRPWTPGSIDVFLEGNPP